MPRTLYDYIYLEDNTADGTKYWWHNWAQNKNQKTSKTWNTVRYSVSNKEKPSTPLQENAITVFGPRFYNSSNYMKGIESVKTEKFKFELDKFLDLISDDQKCPTMSPHQEAIASSTSSLIWGLKEFTKVVDSPTLPWSSLSCFETTSSIRVQKTNNYKHCACIIS